MMNRPFLPQRLLPAGFLFLLLFLGSSPWKGATAQDDLLSLLDAEQSKEPTYTIATFKASRLINGQTIETISKNHLNFWISHRFGAVNSGFIANFFGLDEAKIRLGLEYGLTDRWLVGAGRSSLEKTYDLYTKYKVLRQSNTVPVTVTAMAGWGINTMPSGYIMESGSPMKFNNNIERYSYWSQVLVARKFTEKLSLQLMPTLIHVNKVEDPSISNQVYALGAGGRYKLSQRVTLSAEYYYTLRELEEDEDDDDGGGTGGIPYPYRNALSFGVDIETGGHVFQFHLTNARGMVEKQFIGQNVGAWDKGDIFYGFNIARTFSLDKAARNAHK
jgi:opacity protein-like surface antigen